MFKEMETKRTPLLPSQEPDVHLWGGAQGRKLSPPGTVVDVQQNVAAQRGGSENAKESPHLKQEEAEPAESQARPGG